MATADEDSLWYRPTWVLASVAAIFLLVSLVFERFLHFVGHVLQKRNQLGLGKALEKIKEELMLVGFLSLALTVGQDKVATICIPENLSTLLPTCRPNQPEGQRTVDLFSRRRLLAAATTEVVCPEGKAQFIGAYDMHQLHICIFVFAVVHVIYSVVTMALAIWRVKQWKHWEERATQTERRSHGHLRNARESTFVRRHAASAWSRNCCLAYFAAFFQQFYKAVSLTDYMTLRHGFIVNHVAENASYDFHKYIMRSLENDFEHVVGISPFLWGYIVLMLLFNVYGWATHFWISLVPFILVLLIGMKLRQIITKLAAQISENNSKIEGIPTVTPHDELFWFKRPRFTISLLHFILFQNASAIGLFIWSKMTFGEKDCLFEHWYVDLARLILCFVSQAICSYTTLPINALVSQMGSHLSKDVFRPQAQVGLAQWQRKAKEHLHGKRLSGRDEGSVSLTAEQDNVDVEAHASGRER